MPSNHDDPDLEWTNVEIPRDTTTSSREDQFYTKFMESVMKVTVAGFAGALIGLSRQQQAAGPKIFQRSVLHTNRLTSGTKAAKALEGGATSNATTPSKISMAPAVASLSKAKVPPTAPRFRGYSEETNIPLMWAVSFMAFVSILETSRLWSPSTVLMNLYDPLPVEYDEHDEIFEEESLEDNLRQELEQRQVKATVADYTLGGFVAGLAGGMGEKRPPPTSSSTSPLKLPSSILKSGRRSFVVSGTGTGVVLGLLVGCAQAGLDVAEKHLREEEARQQQAKSEQVKRQQRQQQGEFQDSGGEGDRRSN